MFIFVFRFPISSTGIIQSVVFFCMWRFYRVVKWLLKMLGQKDGHEAAPCAASYLRYISAVATRLPCSALCSLTAGWNSQLSTLSRRDRSCCRVSPGSCMFSNSWSIPGSDPFLPSCCALQAAGVFWEFIQTFSDWYHLKSYGPRIPFIHCYKPGLQFWIHLWFHHFFLLWYIVLPPCLFIYFSTALCW